MIANPLKTIAKDVGTHMQTNLMHMLVHLWPYKILLRLNNNNHNINTTTNNNLITIIVHNFKADLIFNPQVKIDWFLFK